MYRTGKPLSVELGPGVMEQIFDGIQRPLKTIAKMSGDVFIPRGVDVHALDAKKMWEFNPTKLKAGVHVHQTTREISAGLHFMFAICELHATADATKSRVEHHADGVQLS